MRERVRYTEEDSQTFRGNCYREKDKKRIWHLYFIYSTNWIGVESATLELGSWVVLEHCFGVEL